MPRRYKSGRRASRYNCLGPSLKMELPRHACAGMQGNTYGGALAFEVALQLLTVVGEKMPPLDTAVIVLAAITFLAATVNGAIGYGFSSLTVPVALVFYTN